MNFTRETSDQVLIALRRIVRAIDLHSRRLVQDYGLTGPQVVLLRELCRHGELHVSELARKVSLGQATVTDILNRLAARGMIERVRSQTDRRRIMVHPTARAKALVKRSPPLLQEQFSQQLQQLEAWEIAQILSVLQRVAAMMDAHTISAAPLLATGPVTADADAVGMLPCADDPASGTQ
jgi:DNA-binding MarR family transcriptional regulator